MHVAPAIRRLLRTGASGGHVHPLPGPSAQRGSRFPQVRIRLVDLEPGSYLLRTFHRCDASQTRSNGAGEDDVDVGMRSLLGAIENVISPAAAAAAYRNKVTVKIQYSIVV